MIITLLILIILKVLNKNRKKGTLRDDRFYSVLCVGQTGESVARLASSCPCYHAHTILYSKNTDLA